QGSALPAPRTEQAAGGDHGADRPNQTAEPDLRRQTHLAMAAPIVLPAGQCGDGATTTPPGGAGFCATLAQTAQPHPPALLRAGHTQPDVAIGYLHVPIGRSLRLSHRLSG